MADHRLFRQFEHTPVKVPAAFKRTTLDGTCEQRYEVEAIEPPRFLGDTGQVLLKDGSKLPPIYLDCYIAAEA